MHIHIHERSVDRDRETGKRILMLHQLISIAILDSQGDDAALYISSVYVIILEVPVPAGYGGFCDETRDFNSFLRVIYRQDLRGKFPSVDMIDCIPHFAVPGRCNAARPVHDKVECDPGI